MSTLESAPWHIRIASLLEQRGYPPYAAEHVVEHISIHGVADVGPSLLDPDDHALHVVSARSFEKRASIALPAAPAELIEMNGRVFLSSPESDALFRVDVASGEVIAFPVGIEPQGLAPVDGDHLAVALAGESALALVDVNDGHVARKIALPDGEPRSIA